MPVAAGEITLENGDHVVQFYELDSELTTAVGGYLSAAARAGEMAIVVATKEHRDAFEAALSANGVDVAKSRRAGLFVALDAAETMSRFIVDGQVDPVAFDSVIGGLVRQAAALGRPVRAYGEMVALLWDAGNVLAAIEVEGLWNDLGREVAFSLFCAYQSDSVSGSEHADALREVCHLHSAVLHPDPGSDLKATRRFPADPEAPRLARHFVVDQLWRRGHDDDLIDDAALVVGELAANAVVHAASPFTVDITARAGTVRISVGDASTAPPRRRAARPLTASGRGIGIVAAIADSWGTDPLPEGKVVWAELSR